MFHKNITVAQLQKAFSMNKDGVIRLARFVQAASAQPHDVWTACERSRAKQILATIGRRK